MDITVVENQRTGLIRFLVLLLMVFQGTILFLSWRSGQGLAVPALAVVGLFACLYVIARERRLRRLHDALIEEVAQRRTQVQHLDRKVQQGEGRMRELGRLHQAISAVNSLREPHHIYDGVVKAAMGLVGTECGALMMRDSDEPDRLRFSCVRGLEEGVAGLTLKVGEGLAGRVAHDRQPVLLETEEVRTRYLDNPVSKRAEQHLALSVPLLMEGHVTGVLSVGSANETKRASFSDAQLRHLNVFAQHASMAVQYARLRESIERDRRKPSGASSRRGGSLLSRQR